MDSVHDLLGQVTLNDTPTKSKLFRFCEKKIDQWLQTHADGADPVEFRVAFSEDDGEQISCVTEIQMGSHFWRGCDLAHDSQQAFMHSLKRLTPH
jgi:O-phosphoseryl-tRNA(Cys) synthetase